MIVPTPQESNHNMALKTQRSGRDNHDAGKENSSKHSNAPITTSIDDKVGPAYHGTTGTKNFPPATRFNSSNIADGAENPPRRRVLLPLLNAPERRPLENWRDDDKLEEKLAGFKKISTIEGEDNDSENATYSSRSTSSSHSHRNNRQLSSAAFNCVLASAAANEELTSNSIGSNLSFTTKSSDRVLRYGETVDSLFCLEEKSDYEHRKLCEKICSGEKCDDAATWREAMQMTLGSILDHSLEEKEADKKIIALHRRATARFKLTAQRDKLEQEEVLKIWMLYFLVLLKYGEQKDAKQTMKHIQRIQFSTNSKEFYQSLVSSKFQSEEVDLETAIDLLKNTIDCGVPLEEILANQVGNLEQCRLLKKRKTISKRLISLPSLTPKLEAIETRPQKEENEGGATTERSGPNIERITPTGGVESKSSSNANDSKTNKRKAVDEESRFQRQQAYLKSNRESSPGLNTSQVPGGKLHVRSSLAARKQLRAERTSHRQRARKSMKESGSLSAILSKNADAYDESDEDEEESKAVVKNSSFSKNTEKRLKQSSTSPKENNGDWLSGSLTTSAPDSAEARKHFKDISPIDQESSINDKDIGYLLKWDPTKRDNATKVTIKDDNDREPPKKATVPKITRNDLGYMMNWDPYANRRHKNVDSSEVASTQQSKKISSNDAFMMSKIEEVTEASLTGEGDDVNDEHDPKLEPEIPSKSNTSMSSTASAESQSERHNDEQEQHQKSRAQSISKNAFPPGEKVNLKLLPLVEEKNVINVQGEPYAKLGVIGKGGSCKVYRALSANCEVVALKKVRLDGLNKTAIEGYANEIALLNRLKGNQSIIQLHSSEVDYDRKSIFLVMELGEVDLNYVLRQQELISSSQEGRGRSSLNMNFIRLTWQQMLTAVHSIHEERIIHSDLKPANFLFVRGALKLIDFGIAKAIERDDTTNVYKETLSGTLSYMSPEAFMDTSTNSKGVRLNKCGRASDIWSLGCILYQMVYGKTPFADCQGIHQKVFAITNEKHDIDFPDDVDSSAIDAMKLCLQRDPKRRAQIIGKNGLLTEHCFLHSRRGKSDEESK